MNCIISGSAFLYAFHLEIIFATNSMALIIFHNLHIFIIYDQKNIPNLLNIILFYPSILTFTHLYSLLTDFNSLKDVGQLLDKILILSELILPKLLSLTRLHLFFTPTNLKILTKSQIFLFNPNICKLFLFFLYF